MARTVIDLDDELAAEAARLLGTKTKVATVNEALRRVVAQRLVEDERRTRAVARLFDPTTSQLAQRAVDAEEDAWR